MIALRMVTSDQKLHWRHSYLCRIGPRYFVSRVTLEVASDGINIDYKDGVVFDPDLELYIPVLEVDEIAEIH